MSIIGRNRSSRADTDRVTKSCHYYTNQKFTSDQTNTNQSWLHVQTDRHSSRKLASCADRQTFFPTFHFTAGQKDTIQMFLYGRTDGHYSNVSSGQDRRTLLKSLIGFTPGQTDIYLKWASWQDRQTIFKSWLHKNQTDR